MWDDANVNLNYKPSLSHTHRLTCSPYCGSNCDEGPIFLQCCRQLGVGDYLMTGATSHSELFCYEDDDEEENKGVLEEQKKCQEEDLVDAFLFPFYFVQTEALGSPMKRF